MRGCALLSVTLATASCSWLQSLDKDQTLDWSAEKLYSEARVALDDSNWTQAKDYYQKLEARYPFGQYAQQAQIDKLVGLRSQIIEDLRDNLSNVGQRVTVDRKTGAVTFESSVLFDTGKNEIKDAGKAALNSCIPVYIHTLLSDEYRDYVGEIIVEGHTDTTGQYLNNLALSQQRALAVATYCLSDEMTGLSDADKETFKSILTANGRADADPIYNADGTVNMDASRRVVIKFRMKDSDMIDQMSAILEGGSRQGE